MWEPGAACQDPPSRHISRVTDAPEAPRLRAILRVIDLETTGHSFTNGGVVEVGWQDLTPDADGT